MSHLKKKYQMIFIVLMAFSAFVLITSAVITMFYEKAVIRYLKSYLDEHLLTQISVDDIRFRLLKGFPNATFELKNIVILSGEDFLSSGFEDVDADTMLKAGKVTFEFDLIGLMKGNYELKQIELASGTFNFLVDGENHNNLSIWDNKETGGSQDQELNLNSIHLNEMNLNLVSLPGNFHILAFTDKMVLKGSVSHDIVSADIKGDLLIHNMHLKSNRQFHETAFQLQLNALVSNGEIELDKGEILYGRTSCLFSGLIKTPALGSSAHLDLEIPDFRIEELLSLWQVLQEGKPFPFSLEGKGMMRGSVDGSFDREPNIWSFRTVMELKKAMATFSNNKSITDINCSGSVSGTFPGKVSFDIGQYTSSLSEGRISGEYVEGNGQQKRLTFRNISIFNLSNLYDLTESEYIKELSGSVSADFTMTWPLGTTTVLSFATFIDNLGQGNFLAHDVTLEAGNGNLLQNISGKLSYNGLLALDSVSFDLEQNHYNVNGTVDDLVSYLSRQEDLVANLSVFTDKLDLSSYLPTGKEVLNDAPVRSFSFPVHLDLNANVHAGSFFLNQFHANDLVLQLVLKQNESYINNFTFNFLDGSISGNALIKEMTEGGFSITCNATTRYIDIHELFKAFNNFTQHFIVEDNVRGRLDGSVNFSAEWDSLFRLMPGTIKASSDIEIRDGELVQFEPMMQLSRYIDAEELTRVRFSTLKNQIMIRDRMVMIPEMEIHSSAFNIIASGNHSFDNVFDYRLRVLLSEVLFNRARNRRSEIREFYVEDDFRDQRGIPLVIAGTPDNFDVQFDRRRAFSLSGQNRESDDNTLQNNNNASDFIIDWDRNDDEGISQENNNQDSSEQEFIIQWGDEDD